MQFSFGRRGRVLRKCSRGIGFAREEHSFTRGGRGDAEVKPMLSHENLRITFPAPDTKHKGFRGWVVV